MQIFRFFKGFYSKFILGFMEDRLADLLDLASDQKLDGVGDTRIPDRETRIPDRDTRIPDRETRLNFICIYNENNYNNIINNNNNYNYNIIKNKYNNKTSKNINNNNNIIKKYI